MVRFDFAGEDAGTYIRGYMNTTSWSGDFGTNDISTFSGEWKVYDADTVVFEVADSIAATGVEVTPATASPSLSNPATERRGSANRCD